MHAQSSLDEAICTLHCTVTLSRTGANLFEYPAYLDAAAGLNSNSPGLIESRRQEAGALHSIDEFAAAIVRAAADDSYATGDTIYVGSTDWH